MSGASANNPATDLSAIGYSSEALEFTGVLEQIPEIVRAALDEDLGGNPGLDVTSVATIPADQVASATVVNRAAGTVAGLIVIPQVLEQVAQRLQVTTPTVSFAVPDGTEVPAGSVLATIHGLTRVMLSAERTLLNLISRASGVATLTAQWAQELQGTGAQVLDTRKTMPGLRSWDKYAVRCGGGTNKRMGLYDVAMIKDNHVHAAGGVSAAFQAVREYFPQVEVQVEADTKAQALEAVQAGSRFLLLDNMSDAVLAQTVTEIRALEAHSGKVWLEATGNLTLARANQVAQTGVDYLSVGGLTHSAAILDIGLDMN